MSFKREGNSNEWLHEIKKRRVQELFAEDIPEGEAKLMKNGRFYCTVCPNFPTFDTVLILSHHRHGKKHLANQQQKQEELLDLQYQVQKRRHEEYVTTGKATTSFEHIPVLGPGNSQKTPILSSSSAYNPSHKNNKNAMRKTSLQYRKRTVSGDSNISSSQIEVPKTIADYVRTNHADTSCNRQTTVIPYRRKSSVQESLNVCDNHISNTQKALASGHVGGSNCYTPQNSEKFSVKKAEVSSIKLPKKKPAKKVLNEDEKNKLLKVEKYLQARGAGWKKDLSGKWIKDEDVEFDSDEEPPDLP